MRSFYWRWIKTAFRHSLGPIDLWTGIITAALAVVDHFIPRLQLVTIYGWQIPLWILAAIMAVRLILAPYWLYSECRSVGPISADPTKRKRLAELRADGVKLRNEVGQLTIGKGDWIKRINKWREDTISAIREIDEADADWYCILDVVPEPRITLPMTLRGGSYHELLKNFREHDFRLVRLDQLIQKYGARYK
jgi:hypothetical protein